PSGAGTACGQDPHCPQHAAESLQRRQSGLHGKGGEACTAVLDACQCAAWAPPLSHQGVAWLNSKGQPDWLGSLSPAAGVFLKI
ncbi:MAG: hypothetical protein J5600_04095, partial [Desulfovibrio sp.]|nr:hypothetical protein [Desulfovibrio sp.]